MKHRLRNESLLSLSPYLKYYLLHASLNIKGNVTSRGSIQIGQLKESFLIFQKPTTLDANRQINNFLLNIEFAGT